MEWLFLLIIAGGGWYLYQKSPKKQVEQKTKSAQVYLKEADEAYKFLSEKLDEMLNKDLPRWVKEAEDNLKNWKKHSPDIHPPDSITWQPKKQAARKKDIEADISELKRIKDKFVRILIRFEHSQDVDMKLEAMYDFHQYVLKKADLIGYRGFENMIYATEADQTAWNIKFEEIERRFDRKLSKTMSESPV